MMAMTSGGKLLDLWKAFDKLCRNGILYNLTQKIILETPYKSFQRFSRYVEHKDFISVNVFPHKVSPMLILAPILFLIYINELPHNLVSNSKPFPDELTCCGLNH